MKKDPFRIKQSSRLHLIRLSFTILARLQESYSRINFRHYTLPMIEMADLPPCPPVDWKDTSVTEIQMRHILHAVRKTESLIDTVIVEIGSFRGVTTSCIARSTKRMIVSVDPFIGYGGSGQDLEIFRRRIADQGNISHIRSTSGDAAADWTGKKAGLIFIDAVHDYVNTSFDIETWQKHLAAGGIMALHDTDNINFAGTRRAAFAASRKMRLVAHINDLVMLEKYPE